MAVRGLIAASHLSADRLWDLRSRDNDLEFSWLDLTQRPEAVAVQIRAALAVR